MVEFVDLTHRFHEDMPGFRLEDDDGNIIELSAEITSSLTHEESRPWYEGDASFELTEIRMDTSVGTYLDAPGHRHPGRRGIAELELKELVLPGVAIDVRGFDADETAGQEVLPDGIDLTGHAVLFNFGWDRHWDSEAYRSYPFIGDALVDRLIEADVSMVGVDTFNIDDHRDSTRPAHTKLLEQDILIVENLCNLDQLIDRSFRFYAIPIPAVGAVAMPVRAFAEIDATDTR